MKYTKGSITANYNEAWMKSLSRDEFIERAKGSGLPDDDLGKYWDLVNGGAPQEAINKGLTDVMVIDLPEISEETMGVIKEVTTNTQDKPKRTKK